jgi:tetratricopeptide (TPR) repeat protein
VLICRLYPGFTDRGGGAREVEQWLKDLLQERSTLPDEIVAEAFSRLGYCRWLADDLEAAAPLLRESVELFRRVGNRPRAAWATSRYAQMLMARGAYADALALFEQTLFVFRDLENQAMVAQTLHCIGETLRQLGELEHARESLREAIAIADSTGQYSVSMLHCLADVERDQGRLNDAQTLYLRARKTAVELKNRFDVAYCQAGLACVAALRGDAERAGELWGRVDRIEDETGDRLHGWDRKRYERTLEPVMNEPLFRCGYEAGRAAEVPFNTEIFT